MIEKWTYDCGHPGTRITYSAPVIAKDGTIFIQSNDEGSGGQPGDNRDIWIDAINPDGSCKWQRHITDLVGGSVPVFMHTDEDYVYVVASSNYASATKYYVYALSLDSGSIQKTYTGIEMNEDFIQRPVIDKLNNTLYIVDKIGIMNAVELSTGNILWTTFVEDLSTATIVLDSDGNIYYASYTGAPYCVHALTKDGDLIFQRSFIYEPSAAFIALDRDYTLFVTEDYNGRLFSINRDGSINWAAPVGNYANQCGCSGGAFPLDDRVYICGSRDVSGVWYDCIWCLNKLTGETLWVYDMVQLAYCRNVSVPNVAKDGTIYVAWRKKQAEGKIYAINPDGTLKDEHILPTSVTHLNWREFPYVSIAQDGTIYIAIETGHVIAFEGDSPPMYHRGDYYWQ